MPIPPLSVGEDKLTKAVNLNRARAGQIQKYDRSRMSWNEKIELVSD
jgi:hypothetical protein